MGTNPPQVNVSFVDPETIDEASSIASSYETRMALRGRTVARGMLLVLLVAVGYGVAIVGKFIYLDDQNVVENLALRTWGSGLWAIWAHPTIWPLLSAIVIGVTFVGSIFTPWALVVGLVPAAIALTIWFWPKTPDVPPEPAIE